MSSQIDKLSPKFTFVAGLIGGFLVAALITLVIVLIVVAGNNSNDSTGAKNVAAKQEQQPSIAPPSAQRPSSAEITMREISSDDHIRGDENAAITFVEYSDLECPFCKRFHPTMIQLLDEYEGKVRWVYRHFPLDQLHSKARKEAEATECANELDGNDGFWAYIDRLFEITPSNNRLELDQLPQIAQDVGLDQAEFKACLDSGKYAQHIQEDYSDAVSAGGRGTPYNIIIDADGNKFPVSGAVPYEQLKQVMDSLLQ